MSDESLRLLSVVERAATQRLDDALRATGADIDQWRILSLLVERGVHIIELLYLEDLARDDRHEFLFVCLPLRIRGATASMVRPVAIA